MGTVITYVSRRDRAPYRVLVEEEAAERFDAWLDEHNLSFRVQLADGESMTFEASQVLKRDPIAYGVELARWVTYETDLAHLEMPADLWWSGKWGSDEEQQARDAWIAAELEHD